MLADIFNAYGCPEVPQVASDGDGTLRTIYFPKRYEVAMRTEHLQSGQTR
jgi:hypothetical protein